MMIDPWWNPHVEDQAIDRCHRIGQEREVNVVRFTIQNTVEDRILLLQEKKKLIADGALGEGAFDNLSKLSLDDLKFLFKGGQDQTKHYSHIEDQQKDPVQLVYGNQ